VTWFFAVSAVVAVFIAAVNSGFEVGIYSLSRVRLRYRLMRGEAGARALDGLLHRPERLICAVLVMQNLAVYFVTAVFASALEETGVQWAEVWSTLVLAVVFFILVEAVPKNIFRHAADVLVYPLARPFRWLLVILAPAVLFLRGISHLVVRIGGGRAAHFDPFFTRERLAFYMREGQSEGVLSRYQVELTQNILRGEEATVERAMVPMEEVAVVPEEVSWPDFQRIAREKGFSRYPVYRGEKENITGILNIFDCHRVQSETADLRALIRPPARFSPDVHVAEALRILRESRRPMGIVERDGRAIGIVTLKDCVEEIVGELYEW